MSAEQSPTSDATSVADDVLEIVAKQVKADRAKVSRSTSLAELNIQSLDLVEIIFSIEDKFDIEVPYNANDPRSAGVTFQTVGDVIDAIAKLTSERDARKTA